MLAAILSQFFEFINRNESGISYGSMSDCIIRFSQLPYTGHYGMHGYSETLTE